MINNNSYAIEKFISGLERENRELEANSVSRKERLVGKFGNEMIGIGLVERESRVGREGSIRCEKVENGDNCATIKIFNYCTNKEGVFCELIPLLRVRKNEKNVL